LSIAVGPHGINTATDANTPARYSVGRWTDKVGRYLGRYVRSSSLTSISLAETYIPVHRFRHLFTFRFTSSAGVGLAMPR